MWDEAQLFVIVGSVVRRLWMAACPATGIHVCALEMESCGARFSFLPSLSFSVSFLSPYIALLLIGIQPLEEVNWRARDRRSHST